MKIPADGAWNVDHDSNRGLAVFATKNISFDEKGYATLANRTADVFDEANSASFRCPIAIFQNPDAVKEMGTGSAPFTINLSALPYTISIDGLVNQPTGSSNSSQAYFAALWTVSDTSDIRTYNGTAWTDRSASLTSGVRHPLCVHRGNNSLIVGNGPGAKQYDTSFSETTNLTIPSGVEVVGIAYNRSYAALITWDAKNREAWVYLWDGATAAANYAFPLGSNRAWYIAAFEDGFITINGLGEMLSVSTDGVVRVDALPAYFTSAIMSDVDDRLDVAHDTAIFVDGPRILFNVMTIVASKDSEPDNYIPTMPSGLWCWEKGIGLYHRHAPSGAKLSCQSISPGSIDTGTDIITATAAPATGTPFVYCDVDTSPITPLARNTIYYVINLSATTFKVALTRAGALAGTAVNLTAAASGFNYGFVFMPESDFGQLAVDGYAGIVAFAGSQADNQFTTFFTLFQKYLYGFIDVPHKSPSDGTDTLGIVMDRAFNRGYLIFQRMFSPNVEEVFQKLYVKARRLFTEHDQVVMKYRVKEDPNTPLICRSTATYGTWSVLGTASSQFTTSADLSAIAAVFAADAVKGAYEVEVINGAGSGYTAHITAMSLAAGVYTVTIDEAIRNCAVNDTFAFVIDNWLKMMTKDGETAISSASDPNYSEFPIGHRAKWIQFKAELRGFRVQLEELEIVNTGHKDAA